MCPDHQACLVITDTDGPCGMPQRALRRGPQRFSALAETAVLGVFLDRNRALATEFLKHQGEEPAQWRDAMELGNSDYWLTAGELAEISAALRRVLEPYKQRRRGSRPDGSRRVRIARLIVPRTDSPAPENAGPGRLPEIRVCPAGPGRPGGTAGGSAGQACCDGRTRCGTWPAPRPRTGAAPRRRCCSALRR
jgi:hypothetical protein